MLPFFMPATLPSGFTVGDAVEAEGAEPAGAALA
jgi:hypothetical protein